MATKQITDLTPLTANLTDELAVQNTVNVTGKITVQELLALFTAPVSRAELEMMFDVVRDGTQLVPAVRGGRRINVADWPGANFTLAVTGFRDAGGANGVVEVYEIPANILVGSVTITSTTPAQVQQVLALTGDKIYELRARSLGTLVTDILTVQTGLIIVE